MRRVWLGFLLTGFLGIGTANAQTVLFPTKAKIALLQKDPDWGGLRSTCAGGLRLQSHPIADFSPPPHYTATGPRDDRTNASEPTLRRDTKAVYQLALCYELSKDTRYSTKAEAILDGWAGNTKVIGTEQGKDGFNFFFSYALMGAYLLHHDADWPGTRLNSFVRDLVVPVNNAARENNHGNWGVLLLAASAVYLDDAALLDQARNRWLQLIHSEAAPDGSLPREICRSDTSDWCGGPTKGIKGMAYTHYALEPATVAAEIFLNQGRDVYSTPEGALLCKAYNRAAHWTLHPETFPFFNDNHGKLLGLYNVSYFYILQQRCPNPDAAAVLKQHGAEVADPFEFHVLYGK